MVVGLAESAGTHPYTVRDLLHDTAPLVSPFVSVTVTVPFSVPAEAYDCVTDDPVPETFPPHVYVRAPTPPEAVAVHVTEALVWADVGETVHEAVIGAFTVTVAHEPQLFA
jgi:hypothetical protein